MAWVLNVLAYYLMRPTHWAFYARARGFWIDGFLDATVIWGGLAVLAGLVVWVRKQLMRSLGLVALALLLPTVAMAQTPNFGGEERIESLTYKGVDANAQTDPANHTMNRNPDVPGWGGCVPSSVRTAALHAGIDRDEVDKFWAIAQERVGVGGTYPQMLEQMVREAFPDREWVSYLGSDPAEVRRVYDELSSKGYLVCSTMAWGELYGHQIIAHMVNDPHFSTEDDVAIIEDNNDPPGVYRAVDTTERVARAIGPHGQAWLFAFTELPAAAQVAAVVLVSAAILLLAATLLLVGLPLTLST